MVTLWLRNQTGNLPQGMPESISSVFDTQEEALGQAVHDLREGTRMYSPQRIEAEDGTVLVDRPALEKAAKAS